MLAAGTGLGEREEPSRKRKRAAERLSWRPPWSAMCRSEAPIYATAKLLAQFPTLI